VVRAASAATFDPRPLRAAINDLTDNFGARYPHGAEYRARLAALEAAPDNPAAAAGFQELERQALVDNPLVSGQPLLFVVRHQYHSDHHNTATFFPAAAHECNYGSYQGGGALKTINLATGAVRTLVELPDGVARDPEVHFDGQRIIFSLRHDARDSYHIYQIKADGTGLQQLTRLVDADDLDPLYLPDDDIVFSSTREPKYCGCNKNIMANLFRMGPDGANIHQIGKSTLFEGHGALLPDGRILYDRWEYVDRNFGSGQGLWSCNPDGTNHALYWGNYTAAPAAKLQGRAVPGTPQVVCTFSSCHDRPWGAIAVLDRRLGLEGSAPVVHIWPAAARGLIAPTGSIDAFRGVNPKYEDPYPLSDKYFLCARTTGAGEQTGIYLLDVFGNEILLHTEGPGCFDPMPLAAHPRPAVIPARSDYARADGTFYIQDVYAGTHMQGVERGRIKTLRVVEAPPKLYWSAAGYSGQGLEAPAMNWHDFGNKKILGTVPVEADGSVYVSVPAETFVYFQLLDAEGKMVQSMRSGTMVQPGESASCIGCHDDRLASPPPAAARQALGRPAQVLAVAGAHEFNYRREVQPIFDQYCVRCHDFGQKAGEKLNLACDIGLVFNTSYTELWRKRMIHVVGGGPAEIQPAYSWGSHASTLAKVLDSDHYGVKLDAATRERIYTWIDLNAPYYPSYATNVPDNPFGRAPLTGAQLARLSGLVGDKPRGMEVSFERPELSPCLAELRAAQAFGYAEALALIQAGKVQLQASPGAEMPGFVPCALDQWRQAKYQTRTALEERNRAALREGRKVYDPPALQAGS